MSCASFYDDGVELVGGEGLGEKVLRADTKRLKDQLGVAVRNEADDRNRRHGRDNFGQRLEPGVLIRNEIEEADHTAGADVAELAVERISLQFNDLRGRNLARHDGQQFGSNLPSRGDQDYAPRFRCQLDSSIDCSGPASAMRKPPGNLLIGCGGKKHKAEMDRGNR